MKTSTVAQMILTITLLYFYLQMVADWMEKIGVWAFLLSAISTYGLYILLEWSFRNK